ncbi:Uncharacterised protein [Bordetella pertussis]|nr:Uncharacterised protein [Bordetella pertussis]CFO72559.1 Uncharacterised protein [Bordetella pertussis]CPL35207.1 Uncharacterised protein [Bordetella pertussis]CPN22565.1 Uncharacterised protein [Bordetella pertussis]
MSPGISCETPLTHSAEMPRTDARSRICARRDFSSMERSSLNGISAAGITPAGT